MKAKVTLLATDSLVQSSLHLLLKDERELKVLDVSGTNSEQLEKISRKMPDVILFCLTKDEGKSVRLTDGLRKAAQHTKSVILPSPGSSLNQTEALKDKRNRHRRGEKIRCAIFDRRFLKSCA